MSWNLPRVGTRHRLALLACLSAVCVGACGKSAPPPNPDNQLPIGWMDTPEAGAVIQNGRVTASGWALDDGEVKEVRLYVDGRFKVAVVPSVPRADLKGPYAQFMHGTDKHGWKADIEMPKTSGAHAIIAQAVDDQGATHDIVSIQVTTP